MRARVSLLAIYAISIAFSWLTLFTPTVAQAATPPHYEYGLSQGNPVIWETTCSKPLQEDPNIVGAGNDYCPTNPNESPAGFSWVNGTNNPYVFVLGNLAGEYRTITVYASDPSKGTLYINQLASGGTSGSGQPITINNPNQFGTYVEAYAPAPSGGSGSQPAQPTTFNVSVDVAYSASAYATSQGQPTSPISIDLYDSSGKTIATSQGQPNSPTVVSNHVVYTTSFANIATTSPPAQYKICAEIQPTPACAQAAADGGTKQVTISGTSNANAVPNTTSGGGGGNGNDPSGCSAGPGVTWFVCGIVVDPLLAGINDIGGFLQSVLTVNPLTTQTPEYQIWKNVLALANAMFVLIFLVMIFATVFSLENYTVKKVLPRLVAAVILVQFSYFLCTIVVDIGNVLGAGVRALFSSLAGGGFTFSTSGAGTATTALVATGLVIAAGFAAAGISAIALVMAFITILAVVFTLLLRQVILVLLVVFAPVGIALSVLPNTERFFKMWWTNFIKLILMYPMVMALFGAGQVFAKVAQFNGSGNWLTGIYELIGYVMPLVLVPATFKGAGSLMGFAAGAVAGLSGRSQNRLQNSGMAKRLAENRQRRATLTATNPNANFLRRGLARQRAGFGLRPSAVGAIRMAAAGEGIRTKEAEDAEKKLVAEGLHAGNTSGLAERAMSTGSAAERVAALSLLARTENGRKELSRIQAAAAANPNSAQGKIAASAEWGQAMRANASDVTKAAPHLFGGATPDMARTYGDMSGEKVAGLDASGMRAYLSSTTATQRAAAFGQMAPRERQLVSSRFNSANLNEFDEDGNVTVDHMSVLNSVLGATGTPPGGGTGGSGGGTGGSGGSGGSGGGGGGGGLPAGAVPAGSTVTTTPSGLSVVQGWNSGNNPPPGSNPP